MATRLTLALIVLLALSLCGCDSDQDDPYDGYETPEIDWPSLDPNRYHWDGFQDPFFEGWFFRLVLPEQERSFAFIYSVQNPGAVTAGDGGSFIVVYSDDGLMVREDFPVEKFKASKQQMSVRVGDNRITETSLTGACRDGDNQASWNVDFTVHEPWAKTMGMLTNIPFLPVNWYVGALRASASGTINWNGEVFQFEDALLFQDHNWGDFFPDAYFWLNGMNFPDPDDAVAFAGGLVGSSDLGMFVWRRGDHRYEIRSQDLDSIFNMEADPETGTITVNIYRNEDRFRLTGLFADSLPVLLPAPRENGYIPFTQMALTGRIHIEHFRLVNWFWQLQDEQWSELAGVEIGGNYNDDR